MPAILMSNASTINAENFVDSYVNGNSNLFVAVGRTDEEWADEAIPLTPTDTIATELDMRERIIGIKKVFINGIMIMIPRIEWQEGAIFNTISDTATTGKRAQDYYCITSNNDVYQCIVSTGKKTVAGAEPTVHGPDVKTADGYHWKYLYTVTTSMINSGMLLDKWVPVPFNKHGVYPGGTLTDEQYLHGDVNANKILGAFRVLVTATLDNEGDVIPYSTIYRQVALIADPKDYDGKLLEGDLYPNNDKKDDKNTSDFDPYSGEMIYIENRKPVHREESQKESISLLLIF